MIIMIPLKGTARQFCTLLTAPQTVSNTYARVASAQTCATHVNPSSAYHVQYVVCHVVRRDISAIKLDGVEIAFILAALYWLSH